MLGIWMLGGVELALLIFFALAPLLVIVAVVAMVYRWGRSPERGR